MRLFRPHTFLTSISTPFRDCLASIDEKEALLNTAQVNIQLQQFSQHSVHMKQRLSSQIPAF
jgi:hypothetical protein